MKTRSSLEIRVGYSAPIAGATRYLRVLPLVRPDQIIKSENWTCEPIPTHTSEKTDRFGNRVLTLRHRSIASKLRFQLQIEVETNAAPVEGMPRGVWKMPSSLVRFDASQNALLKTARAKPPLERAIFWNEWVFENLRYQSETGPNPLDSAQIVARKSGNCADFAHVFLAFCRGSGLCARYVAGFNPAQGLLHAWGEVLVDGFWRGFDPTHGRAPSPGCVVVATGRDFHDCAPHLGFFRGAATAKLEMKCSTRVDE